MRFTGSPVRFTSLIWLMLVFISTAFNSCDKKEVVKPAWYEDPARIPCEVCTPFAGYYQLRDMSVNTVNGNPVWTPLPVSTIEGKIFSGYLMLNTFSELTVYRSGEVFNSQDFSTVPFSYTEFYNYRILSDSSMSVGFDQESGEFFPFLGPGIDRIDTIVWDRCKYVRP